jgi:hypothetical protein
MNYSNPRLKATFTDWPYGREKTTATFHIETDARRGQRAVRTTIDPKNGRPGKPKTLTFATQARIVDGDDGKTYIAELSRSGFISIMRATMQFQEESIPVGDPGYAEVRALFGAE